MSTPALTGVTAMLRDRSLADSLESLRAGVAPFMPHLMLLDGRGDPRDRTLQHVRFGPDLAEGLELARGRVVPSDGSVAYAIAWDGFATVDGERSDAVLLEVGSIEDPYAWLLAQPYALRTPRFRAARVDPVGSALLVDRPACRLVDPSRWAPPWPASMTMAGRPYVLAWSASPTADYHKAEYLPEGQDTATFTDMVLLEHHAASPSARVTVQALLDAAAAGPTGTVREQAVLEDGPAGVVVEFTVEGVDAAGSPVREWNVHRYADTAVGVVLLGMARRAGPDDGGRPADAETVVAAVRSATLPDLAPGRGA